jgi:hypothetical protein
MKSPNMIGFLKKYSRSIAIPKCLSVKNKKIVFNIIISLYSTLMIGCTE